MPTATKFICEDCGREFGRPQSLGIHRRQVHGVAGKSPGATAARELRERRTQESAPLVVPDEFADLAAPLQAQRNRIAAQLANVEEEREQLLAQTRRLDAALRALSAPRVKMGRPRQHDHHAASYSKKRSANDEQVAIVQRYLEEHAKELEGGFTGTVLMETMDKNGGMPMGKERVRGALDVLHERGFIRLDKIVVGGGKSFKITGTS